MYAVFEDGSHQYKVSQGDEIEVDYRDVAVGETIDFNRVLLRRGDESIDVGTPTVEDAKIVAEVVEQVKGEKIHVEKFNRRKGYYRRQGHRQRYTKIRISEILPSAAPAASPPPAGDETASDAPVNQTPAGESPERDDANAAE